MFDYRLSKDADADLEGIIIYTIETFGFVQAELYRLSLESGFQRLARDLRIGRRFETRLGAFRKYSCESHVIFYVEDDKGILIVRILHSAMDFVRHLPKE